MLLVTLLIPASYIAFKLLRRHQLSLADPFNNPYTTWSTIVRWCFFGLVLADLVLAIVLHKRISFRVKVLAWITILVAGAWIVQFLIRMWRFAFM